MSGYPKKCGTPRKKRYPDESSAHAAAISVSFNKKCNAEAYRCEDHWHVRDRTAARRSKEQRQRVRRRERDERQTGA